MAEQIRTLDAAERRRLRRARAVDAAAAQDGVLSRAQLYRLGITRAEVRANISAGRWRPIGRHCVCVHTGALGDEAQYWVAVLEAGPRAQVDGESALVLAGLERYRPRALRVSVPRGARIRHRGTGVDIRQTRRWRADDLVAGPGVPRTRPAVAAVRAGLWARSDRQAALLLTMTVQQELATAAEISAELLRIRRDRRRRFLSDVVVDLAGGIGSLNELDVLRGCRERGLPEPDAQAVRRTRQGTYYLDFRWSRWRVALEVDGIQHAWAEQLVPDALRHNSIVLSGDAVLRLPVLGLRLCPDAFFAQVEEALREAGWRPDVVRAGRDSRDVV